MYFFAYKNTFEFDGSLLSFLNGAVPINKLRSSTWIERYNQSGEFKFTARMSSGLLDVLPPGTLVSHQETEELMMVENQIISEEQDEDPMIEISGSSFIEFLDRRTIGMNRNWGSPPAIPPNFTLANDYSWEQAKLLINQAINSGPDFQPEEEIPDTIADTDISGTFTPEDPVERIVERGSLLTRVREILSVDNLGMRMVRKNPFGLTDGADANNIFLIHNGKDRSDSVIFSSKRGDLQSGEYLRTNKTLFNVALVTGKWVETRVVIGSPEPEGLDRRELHIDASDIDQIYVSSPSSIQRAEIEAAMQVRGKTYLATQRQFMVTQADVSPNSRYRYRYEYGIGDIVTVQSNYGDFVPMRVTEFTEIEDGSGLSGHPTLSILDY